MQCFAIVTPYSKKRTKNWVNDKLEIRLQTEKYFRNISRDHLDMMWLIALTFQKVLDRKNISISNYPVFALNVLFGFSKVFQPVDVVLSKSKWKIVVNPCRYSKILLHWKFQIDFRNLNKKQNMSKNSSTFGTFKAL